MIAEQRGWMGREGDDDIIQDRKIVGVVWNNDDRTTSPTNSPASPAWEPYPFRGTPSVGRRTTQNNRSGARPHQRP